MRAPADRCASLRGGLWLRAAGAALAVLVCAGTAAAQGSPRRLTTIESIRQFPGFFHLERVLLRGELAEAGGRVMLRADDREMRVILGDDVRTTDGLVELRGLAIDVGRLEPDDPRVAGFADRGDAASWPKPGEELVVRAEAVAAADLAAIPSVRALALEPWKFEGQTVTVVGNFRGRNLFGDLPGSPARTRYDFVLRGAQGAVWVTGQRPRGRNFDLDVDRRIDSGRWVEVTGVVTHERGLVSLAATQIALAREPLAVDDEAGETGLAKLPQEPVSVVFSSPGDGESDVSAGSTVRVQFSKGLAEATLAGRVRVSYLGAAPGTPGAALEFKLAYDAATRAIELRLARPLEPFRVVRVELLEGITGFDGSPLPPWAVTFTSGA